MAAMLIVAAVCFDVAAQPPRVETLGGHAARKSVSNRLATQSYQPSISIDGNDGDGNRVKKVQNGQTTVYIGAIYEKNVSTGEVTTYYFAGSQRIAMRKNGGAPTWFISDQLGSTSLALDSSGNEIAGTRQKYYPFGETRSGSSPTDRQFTGQRAETGLGSLYDFNARLYSPVLGRFISADTIVPQPADPQSLNRFTYVSNNPLRYTDPSGHCTKKQSDADYEACVRQRGQLQDEFGIIIGGDWLLNEMLWMDKGLHAYGDYLWNLAGGPSNVSTTALFKFVIGRFGGLREIRALDDGTASVANPKLPQLGDLSGVLQLIRAARFTEAGFIPEEGHFIGTLWHELTHYLEFAHPKLVDVYAENSTVKWTLQQKYDPPYSNLYVTDAPIERKQAHEQLANDVRDTIRGTGTMYWTDGFVSTMRAGLTVDYVVYSVTSFWWR